MIRRIETTCYRAMRWALNRSLPVFLLLFLAAFASMSVAWHYVLVALGIE